jgi:hypothetical protein
MTKPQKRTDKNRYPSRYSPDGWVHSAQYVTELICEKKAKVDKKELPLRFWTLPEWLKFYKYQIMLANRLIKKYGEHAVIAALRDNRTWKTYSLRSPFIERIIAEYGKKAELSRQLAQEIEYDFSEKQTFDSNNEKKSIISKLKELE